MPLFAELLLTCYTFFCATSHMHNIGSHIYSNYQLYSYVCKVKVWLLNATITVLTDIRRAPKAGLMRMPAL